MKEITVEEQKSILIEMLKYIDKICRENNIKYFLSGGTLLGAVRHKGFIPWDDDVDIEMPFKDYKKFIEIMKKDEKYNINNPYDNENYYYFFTKVTDKKTFLKEKNFRKIDTMGIFIDVFPIFNVPNSESERINITKKFKKMEKKYFRFFGFEKYYYDEKLSRKVIKAIIFFPQFLYRRHIKNIRNKILNMMEELDKKNTEYVGFIIPPNTVKSAQSKKIYNSTTEVQFEGNKLYAPIEYEKYLKIKYGNYMEFPPIEERISPHNFDAYWK